MPDLSEFAYFPVEFTRNGSQYDADQLNHLLDFLSSPAGLEITDVALIAHGFNNTIPDAESFYAEYFAQAAALWPDVLAGRRLAVVGVLWPSQKFAPAQETAGGAASLHVDTVDAALACLRLHAEQEEGDRRRILEVLADALPSSQRNPAALELWLRTLLALLPPAAPSSGDDVIQFLIAPAQQLLAELEDDDLAFEPGQGRAAGLGAVGHQLRDGLSKLLNIYTFQTMKQRAYTVGTEGVAPLVRRLSGGRRVHLLGHSLGARLMASASLALSATGEQVSSLMLLQAAFSHHGFSPEPLGFFREVLTRGAVRGPLVATYSHRDSVVGYAYALAARLARQAAMGIGDASDRFGGLGHNGALSMPPDEIVPLELGPEQTVYPWQAGKLHNLKSDHYVSGHSDIRNPAVVWAWLSAIA